MSDFSKTSIFLKDKNSIFFSVNACETLFDVKEFLLWELTGVSRFSKPKNVINDLFIVQCTQLTDSNGSMLYEHDSILFSDSGGKLLTGIIRYINQFAGFWVEVDGIIIAPLYAIAHQHSLKRIKMPLVKEDFVKYPPRQFNYKKRDNNTLKWNHKKRYLFSALSEYAPIFDMFYNFLLGNFDDCEKYGYLFLQDTGIRQIATSTKRELEIFNGNIITFGGMECIVLYNNKKAMYYLCNKYDVFNGTEFLKGYDEDFEKIGAVPLYKICNKAFYLDGGYEKMIETLRGNI